MLSYCSCWFMVVSSVLEDVRAGRLGQRAQAAAAELLRCWRCRAGAFTQPVREVGPPAALLGAGRPQPLLRIARGVLVDLEGRLGVGRRVDQGGDVAAAGEHEAG